LGLAETIAFVLATGAENFGYQRGFVYVKRVTFDLDVCSQVRRQVYERPKQTSGNSQWSYE
jgi:hypothetical protein